MVLLVAQPVLGVGLRVDAVLVQLLNEPERVGVRALDLHDHLVVGVEQVPCLLGGEEQVVGAPTRHDVEGDAQVGGADTAVRLALDVDGVAVFGGSVSADAQLLLVGGFSRERLIIANWRVS